MAQQIQETTTHAFRAGRTRADVRGFTKDGRQWLVGKDIADALGIRTDYIARLVGEGDRTRATILTPGGAQQLACISPAGLNDLVMRSAVPQAQQLREWIATEVLPALPVPEATAAKGNGSSGDHREAPRSSGTLSMDCLGLLERLVALEATITQAEAARAQAGLSRLPRTLSLARRVVKEQAEQLLRPLLPAPRPRPPQLDHAGSAKALPAPKAQKALAGPTKKPAKVGGGDD